MNSSVTTQPKTKKRTWLYVGLSLIGPTLICAMTVLCLSGLVVGGYLTLAYQRSQLRSTLHNFLFTVKYQDVPGAYSFFSSRVQLLVSSDELQVYFDNCFEQRLDDYEQVSIKNIQYSVARNADQNKPQGTVAYIKGDLYNANGVLGEYEAFLERDDGEWRIYYFRLVNLEEECALLPD